MPIPRVLAAWEAEHPMLDWHRHEQRVIAEMDVRVVAWLRPEKTLERRRYYKVTARHGQPPARPLLGRWQP